MSMSSNQRPDVLILMTDQLNPYCLGYMGEQTVRTPHIDRLSMEAERAQREGDFQEPARILYNDIPELKNTLEKSALDIQKNEFIITI